MSKGDKMKNNIKWFLLGSSSVLFVAMALVFFKVRLPSAFAKEDRYDQLQVFARVINIVDSFYVEEVDTKELIRGAIKGMLESLDPHTNYLAPELFEELQSETAGHFGGVGIEITVKEGRLTIISPIEDTPAWDAGIKAGDVILEIDGTVTKGMSLAEAGQKMRGKRGSKVTLKIGRVGVSDPLTFTLKRDRIKVKSVKYTDLGSGLGYFKITSFVEETASDLRKALDTHKKNSKGQIRGAILDLRQNPGGLLEQAIEVSDLFLDKGTIVSTVGRNKDEQEIIFAKKNNDFVDFPLAVLINESSASASEIVAGALKDNKRSVTMGKQSFGKGSVQSVIQLGDGSGLKLTVARYFTPSGTSIQAEGIVPDIYLEDIDPSSYEKILIDKPVQREKDIRGHLLGDAEKGKARNSDGPVPLSLAWAINVRKSKDISPRDQLLSGDYQLLQSYNYILAMEAVKR